MPVTVPNFEVRTEAFASALLYAQTPLTSVLKFSKALPKEAILLAALVTVLVAIAVIAVVAVRIRVRKETGKLRAELAQQKAQCESAEMANRAKADFLANMSHEIRTPMNAIVGFTDLALKTELNAELREYLDTVRTSADWLMHIVNDVLEFSRVEAGRLQLEEGEFSFSECIRSAAKIVQPEATAKGLAIRIKIDPQIPAVVRGDSNRLRHVLFNLLDNAVKFTTNGSVMLCATLESKSNDGTLVRVSVADTGIGIPAQKQKFLFEPFRPADEAAASGTFGGHGLGLAISRKLVELMGGGMEFQSQLGAGTTFQFTAWFRKAAKTPAEEQAPAGGVQPAGNVHLSILVAEDNAVNRRLVTKILENAGHRVTCASTGKEAVQQFATQAFELILMDMEMPDMDGLEATRIIRATEPATSHVPIYAITAHTMAGDRERCFAAGMDGFLSKPIQVDEVLRIASELAFPGPKEIAVVS